MNALFRAATVAIAVFSVPWGAAAQGTSLHAAIDDAAHAVENKVIEWRRDIHQHPELSNQEFRTAGVVEKHLKSLGIPVQVEIAGTGVVGVLEGGKPGPVVALRADMDALPVKEMVDVPFKSEVTAVYNDQEVGVMHACGHDTHVAILMGAAEVLAGMREEIPGTIKFIFQPAEEDVGGANKMVEEGVLENPDVDAIFGLHVTQGWAVGEVGVRPAGTMAAADYFRIDVKGRQTHAAQPWAGIDPIVIGSQIVLALQTIVSRQVDVTLAPAVVTVGRFDGGVRNNIIPDSAWMEGTIRTFDPVMRDSIHERIRRTAESIAEAGGAEAVVEIRKGTPVTYNDPELTQSMRSSLERIVGEKILEAPRVTGAEDFAYFQERVPGMYFFLGVRPPDVPREEAVPNHSPYFYADESALVDGVRLMSSLAVDYLQNAGATE